jgi:hypothetical protein
MLAKEFHHCQQLFSHAAISYLYGFGLVFGLIGIQFGCLTLCFFSLVFAYPFLYKISK